ncbi:hypothetical protein HDU79_008678 [Rhizoclosmatium sp. JEL0117]|nr:hypothetical protein HDU79_008678 [Rhizoclosmatium sp. JEL0117]
MVASSQKPEVTRDVGSEWTNTWSNYADLLDYNVVSVGPPVLQQQAQVEARFLWQNSRDMYEQVEQVLAAANSSADNETPAGNMLSELFNSFRPAPTWRSTQLQPLGSAFPMDDGNAPRESSTQVSGTSQSRNTVSSETDFEEFLSAEWSLDASTFSPVLDKNTMGSNTQAQRIAQRIATLGAQQDQELPRISLKPKHIRPKVISVGSLMELANLCQNLKSLNLAFSHVTPDTYIVETGEYASTIYHSSYVGLTLRKVTAADALAELIRKCVGLVNLDLTGCSWVTSDVVNAAVTANGSLRALNLMECPHLPLPLQKLFIVNEAFELKDLVLQASG